MKSMIFGSKSDENEEQKDSDQSGLHPSGQVEDILGKYMSADMQEEMFCFTMGECQLYNLVRKGDRQSKECEFINASVNITSIQIPKGEADGSQICIPMIVVSNEDYDEDQEQKIEEKLPISEDLIFMRYDDGADIDSDDGND